MIRATVLRALVLTAAFAAALTPVTCLGQDSQTVADQGNKAPPKLPAKATKKLPPELLSLLQQKKMPIHSPILVRVFKEEAELEVWKQDTTGRFQILKTYPICRWSGDLGPKLWEGDRQTPEGFYTSYARADESPLQLLSCNQHRLPQQLRQSEQPRRQLADDPRRLLVESVAMP